MSETALLTLLRAGTNGLKRKARRGTVSSAASCCQAVGAVSGANDIAVTIFKRSTRVTATSRTRWRRIGTKPSVALAAAAR